MSGGQLNADVEQYRQAAARNTPPPPIASDPLVTGTTPIEQLLRVLGIAANLDDPRDNATGAEQHAERDARTLQAAEAFAVRDGEAAAELESIAGGPYFDEAGAAALPDQTSAMAQQLPQLAAGIAGSLAGALGGVLQPLTQIPQQAAQGMQQLAQTGLGMFQQSADEDSLPIADSALAEAPPATDFGAATGDLEGLGASGGDGDLGLGVGGGLGSAGDGGIGLGGGGTAPMAYLGPPPTPSAGTAPPSASTAPASAPMTPATPAAAPTTGATGSPGMAGMPMIPPGATAGTANADKDPKTETKRLSVPPVRNGAPVQGRLSIPPALPPLVTKTEAKPLVTRRIMAPVENLSGDAKSDS